MFDSLSSDFDKGLRVMEGMGLTEAFGHLSCRDAAHANIVHITPAMGPGTASFSKCLSFSLDGKRMPGNEALPAPLETPMHLAVYRRRPDVSAICRTHSPFAVSAGAVLAGVPCLHGFSLMLGRRVPVYQGLDLIHSMALGDDVARALGDACGCLLRGNGALAVGEDIPHAVVHAIYLEEACRIVATMGDRVSEAASSLIDDESYRARHKWHSNEAARAWAYYSAKF